MNINEMQVTVKCELTFNVKDCPEYVTFKGAFERDLIKVLNAGISVTSSRGNELHDEQLKEQLIDAILYGLKERG